MGCLSMDVKMQLITVQCFYNEWIRPSERGNSMSNTEIVNETADIDDIELHEVYVYIADDNMSSISQAWQM